MGIDRHEWACPSPELTGAWPQGQLTMCFFASHPYRILVGRETAHCNTLCLPACWH